MPDQKPICEKCQCERKIASFVVAGMKTILAEKINQLFKTYAPGKEWKEYSQKEADAMKNYNSGWKDALKIIDETLQ